jgi:hypothetical protein
VKVVRRGRKTSEDNGGKAWTRGQLVAELQRRATEGGPLSAHHHEGLRRPVRRVFGSWREALRAAGLAPVARGRPPAGQGAGGSPDPLDVLVTCAVCRKPQNDLATHIVQAHLLTPRRYAAAYGPLPDQRAVRLRVVAALREYVDAGGRPSAAELARRAPRLHDAVRKLGLFGSVDAAIDYVRTGRSR